MKEILISHDFGETRVAFLEDGIVDDFFVERSRASIQAGSIYKGIVETIIPGMDAAFINIGTEKRGFLYIDEIINPAIDFDDLSGESPKKNSQKKKNIKELIKQGQEILVQVVKEPIGTKGPRLTTHITLPGRYIVYMPIETRLGISKKINDIQQRDQIREIIRALSAKYSGGVIVRTAATNVSKRDLTREWKYLADFWKKINSYSQKYIAPALVHQEQSLEKRIVRDFFYEDVESLTIDDKNIFKETVRFAKLTMPSMAKRIYFYKEAKPLFEERGVEGILEKAYDKKVYLKSGGHLIIEQMESLVAIDVNTGKFTGKKNLEDTVFKVNLEAADEIARQLRLKDLGGIIIVDFIDMPSIDHRKKVLQTLHDKIQKDKAKADILGMSELCLVEMTRQRVRKSLEGESFSTCPCCDGLGVVKTSLTLAIEAMRKLKNHLIGKRKSQVQLQVPPQVASCFANQARELLTAFENEKRISIQVISNPDLKMGQVEIK